VARLPSRPSRIVAVAGAALVAAACSGDRTRPTTSTTEAAATVITAGPVPSPFPVVSLACSAGHPDEVVAHGLIELKGDAGPASLWALVFHDHPFVVSEQVKIAWHMTGTGPLRLSASNLDTGKVVAPWNGPDAHSSSSWHRPGEEWGSVWVFPSAGCWRITAARSNVTGSLTVTVNGLPE
jgi:hypothetical protein